MSRKIEWKLVSSSANDSPRKSQFFKKPPRFPQRHKCTATLIYPSVYIIGGRGKFGLSRDVVKLNLVTQEWTNLNEDHIHLPCFEGHAACFIRGQIYIFGGNFSILSCPLWIYDIDHNEFIRLDTKDGTKPSTRRGHTMVPYMDKLFIFGGFIDLRGSTNDLWVYDLEVKTEAWRLIEICGEGPCPRSGHTCVVFSGYLWIYGGRRDLGPPLSDMWKFHIETSTWFPVRKSNAGPLYGHSACVSSGKMYIFGGEMANGQLNSDLWCFNFVSESFTKLSSSTLTPNASTFGALISMDYDPSEGRALSSFIKAPLGYQLSEEGICPVCKDTLENEAPAFNKDVLKTSIIRHNTQSSADSGYSDHVKQYSVKLQNQHSENNNYLGDSSEPLVSVIEIRDFGGVNPAFQGSEVTIASTNGEMQLEKEYMNLPGSVEDLPAQKHILDVNTIRNARPKSLSNPCEVMEMTNFNGLRKGYLDQSWVDPTRSVNTSHSFNCASTENQAKGKENSSGAAKLCDHIELSCLQFMVIGGKSMQQSGTSNTGLYEPLSAWVACQQV